MCDLQIFESEQFGKIRIIMRNGEPWFVGKDICDCLGTATNNIPAIIDDDERGVYNIDTPSGEQQMTVISEPGLYSLILRSRKPEAKTFKRWVTHEVLPSIRKTGAYAVAQSLPNFADPAEAAIAWAAEYKRAEAEKQQKLLAESQRDEAIRTKAWIADRKTATAMNTASQFSKENDRLRTEIGDSKQWKQVKAITWLPRMFHLSPAVYVALGKKLTKLSYELGYPIRTAPSSEFGTVNVYHVDVVNHLFSRLVNDPYMLSKYRR